MTWQDDFNKIHEKILDAMVCVYCRKRPSYENYCCHEAYQAKLRREEEAALAFLRKRGYNIPDKPGGSGSL